MNRQTRLCINTQMCEGDLKILFMIIQYKQKNLFIFYFFNTNSWLLGILTKNYPRNLKQIV